MRDGHSGLVIAMISFFYGAIAFAAAPPATANTFTSEQQTQIQTIVHDYIIKNPEILVEATKSLRDLRLQEAQKEAIKIIQNKSKELFQDPLSPVAGNPKGDVTIVEFLDYQCSHCKGMDPVIQQLTAADPKLRIIYKQLPVFGPESEFAAKAALASQQQGKFLKFHHALMQAPNPFSEDSVLLAARESGLDVDKLKKDMQEKEYFFQLKDNYGLSTALGIIGTPDFIVATHTDGDPDQIKAYFIPGATSAEFLQKTIENMRKKQ